MRGQNPGDRFERDGVVHIRLVLCLGLLLAELLKRGIQLLFCALKLSHRALKLALLGCQGRESRAHLEIRAGLLLGNGSQSLVDRHRLVVEPLKSLVDLLYSGIDLRDLRSYAFERFVKQRGVGAEIL